MTLYVLITSLEVICGNVTLRITLPARSEFSNCEGIYSTVDPSIELPGDTQLSQTLKI